MLYQVILAMMGLELTTLEVIGTDWKFLTEQVIYNLFLSLESIFNSEIFITSLLFLS
jgi:hypothetical protein